MEQNLGVMNLDITKSLLQRTQSWKPKHKIYPWDYSLEYRITWSVMGWQNNEANRVYSSLLAMHEEQASLFLCLVLLFQEGDQTSVPFVARALVTLQQLYGAIPAIYGLGDCAKVCICNNITRLLTRIMYLLFLACELFSDILCQQL